MAIILGDDREARVPVSFPDAARTQAFYIVGKSGQGKTTLMTNMAEQDVAAGHGMLVLDPHETLVDSILMRVPPAREGDVILFDVADPATPVGVNAFRLPEDDPALRGQYVGHVTEALRKAFGTFDWGIRIQTLISMSVAVLLNFPHLSIKALRPFIMDPTYRWTLLNQIDAEEHEEVIAWWRDFEDLDRRTKDTYLVPVRDRLAQIFADRTLRRILYRTDSTLDFREVIAKRQIVLVRFPERMPKTSTALLGTLILGQFLAAAFAREDIRDPFMVYVDEYHRFETEDYATIINELRYKNVCLTFAHQNRDQLDVERRNVPLAAGSLCCFQVTGTDAERFSLEYSRDPRPPEMIARVMTEPVYEYWDEEVYDGPDGPAIYAEAKAALATVEREEKVLAAIRAEITDWRMTGRFATYYEVPGWSYALQPELLENQYPTLAVVEEAIRRQGEEIDLAKACKNLRRDIYSPSRTPRGRGLAVVPGPNGEVTFRFPPDHPPQLRIEARRGWEGTAVWRDFAPFFAALTKGLYRNYEFRFWSGYGLPLCLDDDARWIINRHLNNAGSWGWFLDGGWKVTPMREATQLQEWVEGREAAHAARRAAIEERLKVRRLVTRRRYLYDRPVQDEVAIGSRRDLHVVSRYEKVPAPSRPIADIQKEVAGRLVDLPRLTCRVRLAGAEVPVEHDVRVRAAHRAVDPGRVALFREAARHRFAAPVAAAPRANGGAGRTPATRTRRQGWIAPPRQDP